MVLIDTGDGYYGSCTSIITAGSCQSCMGNHSVVLKRRSCYDDDYDTFPVMSNRDDVDVEGCLEECQDTDTVESSSLVRRLLLSKETAIKDSIESVDETVVLVDDGVDKQVDEVKLGWSKNRQETV